MEKDEKILILSINNFSLEKKKILDNLISKINFLDINNKDYFLLILNNKKYLQKISQNFFQDFLKIILKFFKKHFFENCEKNIFNEISIYLNNIIIDKDLKNKIFNSLNLFLDYFDYTPFFANENFFEFLKNFIKFFFMEINKFSEYLINKLVDILKDFSNTKNNLYIKIEIFKLIKIIIKKLEFENISFIINLLKFFYNDSKENFNEEIFSIIIDIHIIFLEKNNLNDFLIFFLENYFDYFKNYFFKDQKLQILILKNIHFFFEINKNDFFIQKTEFFFGNLITLYNLDFQNNFLSQKFNENEFSNLLEIFQNSLSLPLSENFVKNLLLNFSNIIINFNDRFNNDIFFYQINMLFFLVIHYFIDYLIFFKIDLNFISELFLNFNKDLLNSNFEKKIFLISQITFLNFFSNLDFIDDDKKNFYLLLNSIFENFFNFQNYRQSRNITQKIGEIERYYPLSQLNELTYFKSTLEKIKKNKLLNIKFQKKINLMSEYQFIEIKSNIYDLRRILLVSSSINKFIN